MANNSDKKSTSDCEVSISDRQTFLKFGDEVIQETRSLILDLWNADNFSVETKEDTSPVTTVDLKAEEKARELIQKRFPSHGIIGEEYGNTNPDSEFQWTIDPIDGTRNLVNRIPTFGTLLGLRFRDQAILGFIDHPAIDVYCKGGLGLGVTCDGKPCKLNDLANETLSPDDLVATSTFTSFKRNNREEYFEQVLKCQPNIRIYYDCYAHTLTVMGRLAATFEINLKIWDLTPSEALIKEVGGEYLKPAGLQNDNYYHGLFGKPRAVRQLAEAFS